MATLRIKPRHDDAFEHELQNGTMTIGRVNANTIVIRGDTAVSRQHCQIEKTNQGIFITDLGSSNGTRVNGQKIGSQRVPLKDGDRIRIGGTQVRLADPKTGERSAADSSSPADQIVLDDGTVFTNDEMTCGRCGERLDVERVEAGQKVGCGRCRAVHTVPDFVAQRTAEEA
jgi:pSer/pThr/pTyr-binding forkhead associated (FHA) protein